MNSILMPTPDRPRPELLASLPELRAKLKEQRQFRAEQLALLGDPVDGRHPGLPDKRRADPGYPEITDALADGARRVLADIETALHRMHTGRYGTCLRCAAPIEVQRLLLIPYLALCEECQR